jgi:peptidoglycan L-alanyl-D-glutamate endopeptidase CwlK
MIRRRERLDRVHPLLRGVVIFAAPRLPFDIIVVEGARTRARQVQLFAQGRTTSEMRAAGIEGVAGQPHLKKVTWTLDSKHIPGADGFSRAVDIAPVAGPDILWAHTDKFDAIAAEMFAGGKVLSVKIRWGADWDRDGKAREKRENDSPHWELDG